MAGFLTSFLQIQSPVFLPYSLSSIPNLNVPHPRLSSRRRVRKALRLVMEANSSNETSTKLVTFLGKGGSGKTTAAVFAAQVRIPMLFIFASNILQIYNVVCFANNKNCTRIYYYCHFKICPKFYDDDYDYAILERFL